MTEEEMTTTEPKKPRGVKNCGGVSRINNSRRQNAIRRGDKLPIVYTMTVEEALRKAGLR